jgi:hypothetical protein
MKNTLYTLLMLGLGFLFNGCESEDPGPLQDASRDYAILDFDEVEMGSGFNIRIEQANTFSIHVEGDRRNLNDLDVFKSGSALIIRYDENEDRNHQTYITITMPELRKVNFSGGCISVIEGFESDGTLDFILSGGSVAQLDAGYRDMNLIVSGGSVLKMFGLGDVITADVSGASVINAFDFPVREASIRLTGASSAKVTVSDALEVVASGASHVSYRGNPSVDSDLSGGSTVHTD